MAQEEQEHLERKIVEIRENKKKTKDRKHFLVGLLLWICFLWLLLHELFGTAFVEGDAMRPAWTVPGERDFYPGDNRPLSLDSRVLGAVGAEDVLGKVICVIRFGC